MSICYETKHSQLINIEKLYMNNLVKQKSTNYAWKIRGIQSAKESSRTEIFWEALAINFDSDIKGNRIFVYCP